MPVAYSDLGFFIVLALVSNNTSVSIGYWCIQILQKHNTFSYYTLKENTILFLWFYSIDLLFYYIIKMYEIYIKYKNETSFGYRFCRIILQNKN